MTDQIDRTIDLSVSGMTCGHCVTHVTEELLALAGVKDVMVTLDPEGISQVKVVTDVSLSDEALISAVAEAGNYPVQAITRDHP